MLCANVKQIMENVQRNRNIINQKIVTSSRTQWPHGVRGGSASARLLGLRVQIPPVHRCLVSCECCVLSGRGLCVGLHRSPTHCGVSECDCEASIIRRP